MVFCFSHSPFRRESGRLLFCLCVSLTSGCGLVFLLFELFLLVVFLPSTASPGGRLPRLIPRSLPLPGDQEIELHVPFFSFLPGKFPLFFSFLLASCANADPLQFFLPSGARCGAGAFPRFFSGPFGVTSFHLSQPFSCAHAPGLMTVPLCVSAPALRR